ncbi:MAG TPA: DNA topoisomerase I [Candidatus Bathyarchaeia archaeon]|nr:DNA topoisomerase I [Candidatus Bathyarchaeia archaeon]
MEKCVLIITEKPDAALHIAQALNDGRKPKKVQEGCVPYFVVQTDKKIIIAPAIGHLYTVAQTTRGSSYPVFDYKWVPRYVAEKKANFTRGWIDAISHLARNASEFIDACDYDIEGSLIGYSILKYACAGKEKAAKRMKYSTLTEAELKKAYEKPLANLDFALIEAGLTRHEVDWLYGINLSRALTNAAKRWNRGYANLSTGRVQGPTLEFLVTREREIGCHVPTPYWSIHAKLKVDNQIFVAEYEKKVIDRKAEAYAIQRECNGKRGAIDEINMQKNQISPPIPFDLGTLQAEAYRIFSYTPRRTSDVAQRLYLDAMISYPRTSSQKLPQSIGYRRILNGLKDEPNYQKLVPRLLAMKALKPREGKSEDPAHPAIYPTGNKRPKNLDSSASKIWDLIVRRFMAAFGEPALRQTIKISIKVNGHRFFTQGVQILSEGWMQFYDPYVTLRETSLPLVEKGERVDIVEAVCENKFTAPPPRYNPSSLLKKMETEGIGTKATRADIIETLHRRKYITDERIKVTDLGFSVATTLHKYCPGVVSVLLTKDLEAKMERVKSGEKRENVLADAIAYLKPLLEEFKEKEEAIGKALGRAVEDAGLQERIISDCPTCKTGKLIVLRSRKTGKRFIGCTNYFKNQCKTSVPIPQRGKVKPTGRKCKICSWPTVIVTSQKGRPWELCVNPTCSKKGNQIFVVMQSMQ